MWVLVLRMAGFFKMVPLFFCFLLIADASELKAAQEECKAKRCNHQTIRFPFRLRELQPDHCGYRGFELSCIEKNQTVLELPQNVKLVVKHIDYRAQTIQLSDPEGCLPLQLPNLNLSASPFQSTGFGPYKYTVFNCSREANVNDENERDYKIPCLSSPEFQVLADYSDYKPSFSLVNCTRTLLNISETAVYRDMLHYRKGDIVHLSWSKPDCRRCEAIGRKCKSKIDGKQDEIDCFGTTKKQRDMKNMRKILLAMGIILGTCLLGLILFGLYRVHRSRKAAKEGQLKIEKFLEDYRALKPSRYSYVDIKRITDQFKDKLGEGAYGNVFKGRLSNDVWVAVKVLNNFNATGEEFINEVGSMCRIHHVNVTRLIGFCADGNKRALVYEYMPNESLEKFIFFAKEDHCLGWEKLQDIAMGIAKGIEYLHHGCDQQILHFDIKPHNILLDHNYNPKIADFGLAKLCSKEQSAVSMTAARGTIGYMAPEVLSRNFGKVTHKSDVYSFGMLLLEMVGGRKNIDASVESTSQVYFLEWVYDFLDRGAELRIRIENEGHAKIARKLTIVGLWCIQWYPTDRPSMKAVIHMLEGEVDNLIVPPNPFGHADGVQMVANIPKKPINKELAPILE